LFQIFNQKRKEKKRKDQKRFRGCGFCMRVWVRDCKRRRLIRFEPEPKPESQSIPELKMVQERPLNDIFYPLTTTLPSCFNLLDLGPNVTFELRSYYIQMLPKFAGLEDAYLFLREFEEVCSMMHFPNIPMDVVHMKLIPFALKDFAKRWMYGLAANFVTSWDDFVKLFQRKYFPNAKTVTLRNEINQFVQLEKESFWRYLDRFKNLLARCPHRGLEQSHLCQICI